MNTLGGGCADNDLKNVYMQYYREAVRILFSDYTIRKISLLSKNYILGSDYRDSILIRCENYDYLYSKLKHSSILRPVIERKQSYVPFMLVAFCDCRDELLKYLIAKDIYCTVHWRLQNIADSDTKYLCDHVISFPCDQRYSTDDMERIVREIAVFEEGRNGG